MLLDAVGQRLDTSVSALKKIAGAADFASAGMDIKSKGALPAAYVLPLAERADANGLANAVSQRVEVRFGVILAISNLRDALGKNAQGDLAGLRTSVFAALLGWQPDADHDPVTFGGGRLLQLQDGLLWWQDEFVTAYYLRDS
jgi:hypothetical protein